MAAIKRTSTLMVLGLPSRSNSPVSRTRSSLAWTSNGSSPTSSRKSVESVRDLEAPDLARQRAGEGALLPAEELAFDETGRQGGAVDLDHHMAVLRGLSRWMARATSSLPVPVSP